MNGLVNYNAVVGINEEAVEVDSKTYDGFYISYNDCDVRIYGSVTTALVLGQMQGFYILNGDHRKQYAELIGQGFQKCLEYYKANIENANHYSDKLPVV